MEHPWEPPAPKATTFTDLATELVEQIATLSWCTGLLALRLVNRDLNSKTLYTFTKAHFTTRSFLLCEISLRTLPRIAEHDTSGRSLKTLTVYDGEILKPEDWLRCWAPAELPFLGDGYNALYEAQQQFQKLKVDLFLVTRIFERLKSFNTTIEVQVQVYGDKHNSGHPTIHGGVAGDKLIWAQNEQSGCRPTKLIVEALASSGFSPSKFTVHGHGWWRSLYIFPKAWGLNHNIVRRPDHIKMFNGLEHLNLVDVLLTPGDGHALRSMSGILAASSILETLTLSGREIKQIDRKSILYSRYYDRSGNCLPPPLRLSMKCSRLKTLRTFEAEDCRFMPVTAREASMVKEAKPEDIATRRDAADHVITVLFKSCTVFRGVRLKGYTMTNWTGGPPVVVESDGEDDLVGLPAVSAQALAVPRRCLICSVVAAIR
ncbi:hypothetical protein LTR09_012233 [Extremus antarcticus]|uniref:Uncharacterized protein n=1 Tax=Extremus antarcticus TaxID=702011 RepID=A0AAJ0DAG0_9PEZI|nr:hypothetical protein LTR09_012233 [Extremus antarcticus]